MAGICGNLAMVIGPHLVCIEWLLPLLPVGRVEPSATHSAVPQPIGGVYSLGGSIESHLIPSTFSTCWGGVFFSRFGAIK